MSRAYTKQESINALTYKFETFADYWQAEICRPELREKVSGVCFSMLSTMDGCAIGIPQVKVVDQAGVDLTQIGLHDHYHRPYSGESVITTAARIVSTQALSCTEAVRMFLEALISKQCVLSMNPHPDDKDYHIKEGENWYDPDITFTAEELLTAFQAFQK
jgi:hypothetical protein